MEVKVTQFIKKLNNTELGKTGNDKYVVIPSGAELSDMFEVRKPFDLVDKKTGEVYNSVSKERGSTIQCIINANGQYRISGIGFYWGKYNFSAGDEVIFEKYEKGSEITFYIDSCFYDNVILFQKDKNGFQILNIDRIEEKFEDDQYSLNVKYYENERELTLKFLKSEKRTTKKQGDVKTDYYDLVFDGESLIDRIKSFEYLQLSKLNGNYFLTKENMWRKTITVWEE